MSTELSFKDANRRTDERKVIVKLIDLYKTFPCLWDITDPQYPNKEARREAYNILLSKYKEIDDKADIECVKKKLDHLRTGFRRERKKVLSAKAIGRQHFPKLWYYKQISFICKNDKDEIKFKECQNEEIFNFSDSQSDVHEYMEMQDPIAEDDRMTKMKSNTSSVYFDIKEDHNETSKSESCHLGEAEAFGRTIGLQLQKLDEYQRYIAEKLISDVIFYGRIKKLNIDSSIINMEND